MPLFFFIAGFLFSNSQKIERIGFLKWGKEKTIKLLTPYVVLSVIAAVPKYYLEHRTFTGMGYYLIKAVLVPRLGVWGHFWFIPVLLFTYLIFGMLKQRIDITPIAMTITLVLSLLIYFLPFNTDWFGISDLKKGFVFFIIGMVVQKLEKRGGYYLV
jgi:fucose 4-O-acetylase-like acetyltransferase